ncbi:transcriptional regulator [Vibrio sp. CJQ_6]|uniref:winged helix-turn-helix domain-containing protein n=1 Tax=Vibrio sp. CJQ_6 TaxID=3367165 RepID=UPI00370BEEB2
MKEFEGYIYQPTFNICQYEFSDGSVFLPEQFSIFSTDGERYLISYNECVALCTLLEYQNTFVMRKTLLHAIWGNRGLLVDENSLNQCISRLRKQINHSCLKQVVQIETLPKIGYKIVTETKRKHATNRPKKPRPPITKPHHEYRKKLLLVSALSFSSMISAVAYLTISPSGHRISNLLSDELSLLFDDDEREYVEKTQSIDGESKTIYCFNNTKGKTMEVSGSARTICLFKDESAVPIQE